MLGNVGVFSFLRSWKLTRFLTTCISASPFKIWTFRDWPKSIEGGGPEHLEMWLIKNTWPTPSLRHTNDWPTPNYNYMKLHDAPPSIKTWIFGFLLILQWSLALSMTEFVDTLLQAISKSQKSYLSLKRQMWKTGHFLFFISWTLWVLAQIYRKTRVLPGKHMKISTKTTYSYTLLAGNA